MCGRYKGPETWAELHEILGMYTGDADLFRLLQPEIFPTNNAPICLRNRAGQFEWVSARWGLIPHWHTGGISDWKATSFNTKIEDAPIKPTWKEAWKRQHCVVPAASFWEWSGEHPTEKRKKQRYELTRADNYPLAFAGLWDVCDTFDGRILSFSILTKAPGEDFEGFHDREAVPLMPDQMFAWLESEPLPELADISAPHTWRKTPVASEVTQSRSKPGNQPSLF